MPTTMDTISQSIRVTLGQLGVAALSTDMLLWSVVAPFGYEPERIAVGCNAPWLSEQSPFGACCLAREAVHTTIKVI